MRDEQLKAIGRVVVNFSGLEFFYEVLAWSLAKIPQEIGLIVTSELSFRQKRNLVGALAREALKRDPTAAVEIDGLTRESEKIEEERNRIMHSLWGPLTTDPGGPLARVKFTAKGQLKKHGEPAVDPAKLNGLADQISQITGKHMEFFRRHSLSIPYRVPQPGEETG